MEIYVGYDAPMFTHQYALILIDISAADVSALRSELRASTLCAICAHTQFSCAHSLLEKQLPMCHSVRKAKSRASTNNNE